MILRISLFLLFFAGAFLGNAQQSPFNNNATFANGVYLRIDDFKKNKPTLEIEASKLQYDLNAEENVLILKPETQKMLDSIASGQVWGLCINQIPYIRTEDLQDGRPYFVRIHVVGKLSYFYYKAFREKEVTMYVYNPYTGEKMGQKSITNRELVFIQRLLHFQTGETTDFNYENLKNWTADDGGLSKSLGEMKAEEREGKLFKTLLIYNDRNPVYAE